MVSREPFAILVRAPYHSRRRAEHTMGMPATLDHKWTAEEVLALPDEPGKRIECVDGELFVSPGPSLPHERAFIYLLSALRAYAAAPPRIGEALGSRSDLVLDRYTVVQPDVFVAPLVDGRRPRDLKECSHFLLVAEILSPSSHRADRVVKRRKYQRSADAYWIVDINGRLVERWLPEDDRPEILTESISWHPGGRDEPLVIELPALFREAFGEAP